MAKKTHFVVDQKNKTFTYVVGTLTDEEKEYKEEYKEAGYEIIIKPKEKKKGLTVDEMRKTLSKDKEALTEFNDIYTSKEKGKGFFGACKYYNSWKKMNKKK